MKYSAALVLAASATMVYADCPDCTSDYLSDVCLPTNSTGYPDFNAPCNAMIAIQYQCTYGAAAGLELINELFGSAVAPNTNSSCPPDLPAAQDNSTQRACVCSSQFFNQVTGCVDCQVGHGDSSVKAISPSYISSVSAAYCAASSTPTAGLGDYLAGLIAPTGSSSAASSSFTDPIGNKTAVSYYYTAPVTGTAGYLVPSSTGGASTSNGQIVPTATGGPARATGAADKKHAAVAGVIGLVGLAALL